MLPLRCSAALACLAITASAAAQHPVADPAIRVFLDRVSGGTPIYTLPPAAARQVLRKVQSDPVRAPAATVRNRVLPVGPTGQTRIRIYTPAGVTGPLPAVVYFHGGGWILGDADTHDRLARDLADGAGAVLIFVDYDPSPERRYPIALEQGYAVTRYVAAHPGEFDAAPGRLAVAGDSVGGNMATVVSMLAKERGGPAIAAQLLFYPVTDAGMDTGSYKSFADGPWLTKKAMAWFWDAYLPDPAARRDVHVSPITATRAQLTGLPQALVITAENDVLRDEGEAYAAKLAEAGVATTSVRYNDTIHDFVLLNAIADTRATRGAIAQASAFLRAALAR